MEAPPLQGPRLRLRRWQEADRPAFAAMNADPAVMRYFAAPLDRAASDAFMDRIEAHIDTHGFGFWAVERLNQPGMIGLCGLAVVPWAEEVWEGHQGPAVEIGWRLLPAVQGQGYAREAAEIALAHGFGPLGLDRVFAFTAPQNTASWGLMLRLGMTRIGEFQHPRLPPAHALQPQQLYQIDRK